MKTLVVNSCYHRVTVRYPKQTHQSGSVIRFMRLGQAARQHSHLAILWLKPVSVSQRAKTDSFGCRRKSLNRSGEVPTLLCFFVLICNVFELQQLWVNLSAVELIISLRERKTIDAIFWASFVIVNIYRFLNSSMTADKTRHLRMPSWALENTDLHFAQLSDISSTKID